MSTLSTELRNKLERTIVQARDVAEAGAKAALEALAVHHHEPYGHMSPEERKLRNHLRARARQLGDKQNRKSELEITHLVWECAYEHWHRMLFARFLAENDLLIEPEMGVAISLQECDELAKDEGKDVWTLASEFAQRMLPQIFRPNDPLLKISFAREHQLTLEQLLDNLEASVFTASDSIGWVYQFWQTKCKKEVNQSGNKIGADELPAVTQLFTEPYMVSFLLDNSLGAWWAARRLSEADLENATSEDKLRNKAALSGVPLKYLRFVKSEDGTWTPAVGTFDGWPEHLSELKTLDPCCGSGHFLVTAFLMLVPIRMELEGVSAREAVDAVLRENLHGLEIDRRCVELAAFALALAAWGYPDAGGYRPLPELNVACSGLAISAKKEEWLALAGDNNNLRIALEELYKQFKNAPVLGSLINPEIGLSKDSLFELKWEEVGPLLTKALSDEKNDEKTEIGVVAQGLARAAEFLSQKYDLLATNVPYLARAKQSVPLSIFCDRHFSESKNDLANTFILRSIDFCRHSGFVAAVTKQDWQYQDYEKKFRKRLLNQHSLNLLAWLGARGFSTSMFDLNVVLMIVSKTKAKPGHSFTGLDVSNFPEYEKKALALIELSTIQNKQKIQLNNPDARILLQSESSSDLLLKYASYQQGICTGDLQRFGKKFWEIHILSNDWEFQQSTVNENKEYGGLENIIYWQNGGGKLFESISMRLGEERVGSWLRGREAWGKKGIAVSSTGVISSSLYMGNLYDDSTMVLVPKKNDYISAIWTFCSSDIYNKEVRKVDRKLKVRSALIKVPFDFNHWYKVAKEKYPNGLPKPYSNDPNQWIFHGHPARSDDPLQVAVARLLGYRWPAELDAKMELADEQREWVNKCDGLLKHIDEDGIVCIPSVRGEETADGRLRALLTVAFGPDWSPSAEHELIKATGANASNLDDWLRDHFFEQHCKLFHHRPFIWHIWDGRRRDGFHALVNYHKLAEGNGKGRKLLESLTYSYLGDWITRQKEGVKRGEGGAEDRLAAALELQKRLIAIIEGEPPFDIFVRWKPIEEQPIGWEPDINDGIRLNIRPFMAPDMPDGSRKGADITGGRKGAGILRWKPNIKWNKDRGKDVASAPWFALFKGDRINDHHLSLEKKRAARAEANRREGELENR